METAKIIALEHHEKWNGTGYLGRKNSEIHLESRIVALADVFDALVTERPYKKTFSDEKAKDILIPCLFHERYKIFRIHFIT